MASSQAVPNAWDDDDWSKAADSLTKQTQACTLGFASSTVKPKLSRAQQEALHREENRRIWEAADAAQPFSFLDASKTGVAPAETFRQVRVLSRKPPTPTSRTPQSSVPGSGSDSGIRNDSSTSMPGSVLARPSGPTSVSASASAAPSATASDSDEDYADDSICKPVLSLHERMAKQAREREEKQRRYDEARAKIFGAPASAQASAGSISSAASGAVNSNSSGIGPTNGGLNAGLSGSSPRGRGGRGKTSRGRGNSSNNINSSGPGFFEDTQSSPGTRGSRRGPTRTPGSIPPGMGTNGGNSTSRDGPVHAIRAPRNPPEPGSRGGFAAGKRGGRGRGGAVAGGGVSLV
ncbi:hypothetical protein CFIMG_004622RA [Ceratocystis fimbriata CBS 114723]|uniref:SUZ domain-containing protein n=1 Tax=Ceratocystis fimbriata CBS 114723 TaxID=1035309 RepID=A0A2C5WYV6_9PEZI|nr:hypothetical protein CFIMG_004622RA [Ceratocystis fimbriata CBS 114723]